MPTIIQFADGSRGFNSLDSLAPGVDIPLDARWAKFTPVNGDENLDNYSIDDAGRLLYKGALIPDPAGLKKALNQSADLDDTAKVQLGSQLYLLDTYLVDPEGTKQQWVRIKKVLNLDLKTSTIIETAAAAYGMPLNG